MSESIDRAVMNESLEEISGFICLCQQRYVKKTDSVFSGHNSRTAGAQCVCMCVCSFVNRIFLWRPQSIDLPFIAKNKEIWGYMNILTSISPRLRLTHL